VKKLILILFLLIVTSCNPTYRILTIDYDHQPVKYHKYEIINVKTGEIDTIYDFTYYKPGMYIELKKDNRVPGEAIIKSIIE